jgi:glutathione S-transferase
MMITLYHYWDSFYSFKVRLCLEEKELDWESRNINLMRFENLAPGYLRVNPDGLVPTLVHDGATITESSIINEYLDGCFPAPALRPADEVALARMRYWVGVEEEQLFKAVRPVTLNLIMKKIFQTYSDAEMDAFLAAHPKQYALGYLKKTFKEPVDAAAVEKGRRALRSAFESMDRELQTRPWLAGDAYSLADIAAAPVIDRIDVLNLNDLYDGLGALKDWIARLTARPAYGRAMPKERMGDGPTI